MSSIYHNLAHMALVAVHQAKEHRCNYNVIIMNPDENGNFNPASGSTYEMVMDSYFDKPRNAVIVHRTDDLIRAENLKEGDVIAFGFNYNGGVPSEIIVDKITSVHNDEFIVHFLYGHKSMSESVKRSDVIAIGAEDGTDKIEGWRGNYHIVQRNSKLLKK